MRAWRPALALGALCTSLAACGSDSLERGGSDAAGKAPDYTASPCYGQHRTTLVYDSVTHLTHEVPATCRAEGNRTLVYVTDEVWEAPLGPDGAAITQAEVDAFMARYELHGSRAGYRPELGILPTDELVFGRLVPSALGGSKLPIFIVSSGGAGEGYLCGWCDSLELHLDGPLLGSLSSDKALSIAAHESFHAIHRGYDPDETVWVDESLAEAAMTVNGFFTDQDWLESFLANTNVAWGPDLADVRGFNYGAGLLFGSYLWERGGEELMRAITREPLDGWPGLDAALVAADGAAGTDTWQLYLDMALSLFLDDPASGYSFESFELGGRVAPRAVGTGQSVSGTLAPYGLVFVVLDTDARSITLDTGADVAARLVLEGTPVDVREVPLGQPFDFARASRVLLLTARESATYTLSTR